MPRFFLFAYFAAGRAFLPSLRLHADQLYRRRAGVALI